MSILKNKLVEISASFLASILQQVKVQNALSNIFHKFLFMEDTQGKIDEYLKRDDSKRILCQIISENSELQKALWKATNVRILSQDMHWSVLPNSIREHRMVQATIEAGKFVHEHIPHLEGKSDAFETLRHALTNVTVDGMYLEFGVFSGTTIKYIAEFIGKDKTVHGFDSFEGLPENWGAAKKGTFDTKGVFPEVPDNVILHKGWFDQTIEPFLDKTDQPIAFLHADADLYSSTITILNSLADRIVAGTIIVFDEFINYPYWRDHEYRAFMEFINATGLRYEYIAYTDRGYSVAVRILKS